MRFTGKLKIPNDFKQLRADREDTVVGHVAAFDSEFGLKLTTSGHILHEVNGTIRDTPYRLQVVQMTQLTTPWNTSSARQLIQRCAAESDALLNPNNPKSEVFRVNNAPVGQPVVLSAELWGILALCLRVMSSTGGLFDVSTAPFLRLAKKRFLTCNVMSLGETTQTTTTKCFEHNFQVNEKDKSVTRLHDEAELEFSAVEKGWLSQRIASGLLGTLQTSFCFTLGGVTVASGSIPWTFSVKNSEGKHLRALQANAVGGGLSCASVSSDFSHPLHGSTASALPFFHPKRDGGSLRTVQDGDVGVVCVQSTDAVLASALSAAGMIVNNIETLFSMLRLHWCDTLPFITDVTAYIHSQERVAKFRMSPIEQQDIRKRWLSLCTGPKVAIVGGGVAGMCAALEAVRCGAKVSLLERCDQLGGVANYASAGISAAQTYAQLRRNIVDSDACFGHDVSTSNDTGSDVIPTCFVHNTVEMFQWLQEVTKKSCEDVRLSSDHSVPRVHVYPLQDFSAPKTVFGTILQQALRDAVAAEPEITVVLKATASELVREEVKDEIEDFAQPSVSGVVYNVGNRTVEMHCDAVILAAGGFAGNTGIMDKYLQPDVANFPCARTGHLEGTVPLVEPIKEVRIDCSSQFQYSLMCHRTNACVPSHIFQSGALLLKSDGSRFVDETQSPHAIAKSILSACMDRKAWCVVNDATAQAIGYPFDKIYEVQKSNSIENLAAVIGVSSAKLIATFEEYDKSTVAKLCPTTQKTKFPARYAATDSAFQVMCVTPLISYTGGGVRVSSYGEVIAEIPQGDNGEVFSNEHLLPGLLAAGEGTAGNHSVEGNALLSCIIQGRRAGFRAATVKQRRREAFAYGETTSIVFIRSITENMEIPGCAVLRLSLPGQSQVSGLRPGEMFELRRQIMGVVHEVTAATLSRPEDRGVITIALYTLDDPIAQTFVTDCKHNPTHPCEINISGTFYFDRLRPTPTTAEVKLNGKLSVKEVSFICTSVQATLLVASACKSLQASPFGVKALVRGVRVLSVVHTPEAEQTASCILSHVSDKHIFIHIHSNQQQSDLWGPMSLFEDEIRRTVRPEKEHVVVVLCDGSGEVSLLRDLLFGLGHAEANVVML